MTIIAQVTDTHVADPDTDELHVDNNGRIAEAVRRLNLEWPAPAVVLGTGDLTNDGRSIEFDLLASAIEPLVAPFLPLPGNHDDRHLLRLTFPDVPWVDAAHASWVTVVDGVRIVGVDSTRPGHAGGELDGERLRWLEAVLAEPHDGVTLLAVHHPPFRTGIAWMDRAGFVGLDRFCDVLRRHPVHKVVCGHLHRPVSSTVAGIPVQIGLPTVQSIELSLDPAAGVELILDPVGYLLHVVDGDQVVTHTRYLATRQQPFRPHWADEIS